MAKNKKPVLIRAEILEDAFQKRFESNFPDEIISKLNTLIKREYLTMERGGKVRVEFGEERIPYKYALAVKIKMQNAGYGLYETLYANEQVAAMLFLFPRSIRY